MRASFTSKQKRRAEIAAILLNNQSTPAIIEHWPQDSWPIDLIEPDSIERGARDAITAPLQSLLLLLGKKCLQLPPSLGIWCNGLLN